jgi:hypothetical protein
MVRRRRLLPVGLAGLTVVAGILAPGSIAGASPGTRAAPVSGDTVVVTVADDGAQLTLHVGQQLVVKLEPAGIFRWDQPQSTDSSVLRAGTRAGPARRHRHRHRHAGISATFSAVGTGTADVQATGAPVCRKGKVCILGAGAPSPALVRLWRVTVQVV